MSTTHTYATRRLRRTAIASALAFALAGAGTVVYSPSTSAQQTAPAAQQYSISAGNLREALDALAAQGDVSVVYSPELVAGKTTKGISGRYTPVQALRQVLAGSGLAWDAVNAATFVLKHAPALQPAAPPKPRAEPAAQKEEVTNMPAIMVTGTKTLNMDIMRTEDDPQPYVVFDREQIERSGATSLEQFLQQRLTMNTGVVNSGSGVSTSQITLRGLGEDETLILIDGHRASSPSLGGAGVGIGGLSQVDLTGIPLAAIERIEVLPTTASGIYGGSATGGVINIVMRSDYVGAEIRFGYENSFDSDTATQSVNLIAGYNWNEGKTSLLVTAHQSAANDLLAADRNLVQHGRERVWRNNAGWFRPPAGLPPLGATPNIASRDGSNLVLDNGTPLNASFTSVPLGYAGVGTDGGDALVAMAGIYNWDLANNAMADSRGSGKRQELYGKPTVKSIALVLKHEISESLKIFADLSSSRSLNKYTTSAIGSIYDIPENSKNNPFSQPIRVAIPVSGGDAKQTTTTDRDRVLVGLLQRLPRNWLLGFDYTWDSTSIEFGSGVEAPEFNEAVTSGQIDVLRDTNQYPIDVSDITTQSQVTSPFRSVMKDANARISGPLGSLPGGSPTMSLLLAKRSETIEDSFYYFPTFEATRFYPERSQEVESAYVEFRAPLFSEKNSRPYLRELELQIAVRQDRYTSRSGEMVVFSGDLPVDLPNVVRTKNTFTSVDPTVALRWKPLSFMVLRASYGTGFLPPALNELVPTINPTLSSRGVDPLRDNTPAGPYTTVFGGNADLLPEQSESWSAGFVLSPEKIPNFRLSLDYTRIEKKDNISTHPGGTQGIINNESLFPGRVIRGPRLPGDPEDWAGPITLINTTVMNLAKAELEAWDLQLDLTKDLGEHGFVDFYVMGTWQPHYRVQVTDSEPKVDHVGISHQNPLEFKATGGAAWRHLGWQVGWNASYFSSYKVSDSQTYILNQGNGGKVSNQMYHDLYIKYDFSYQDYRRDRWFSDTQLSFGVKNIFNKEPPFDAFNSAGFYSQFGDPRISSWYIAVTTAF